MPYHRFREAAPTGAEAAFLEISDDCSVKLLALAVFRQRELRLGRDTERLGDMKTLPA